VFIVSSTDRLAELGPETEQAPALAVVDSVIDASLDRAKPSREAAVLAWAGGVLAVRQADRALAVLGAVRQPGDEYIVRSGSLIRLADPASPRLAEQAAALSAGERSRLAAAVLAEAIDVAKDSGAGLVERVLAGQAAHHIRGDLGNRDGLTAVQCTLIRGLEALGDPAAAYNVAKAALDELRVGEPDSTDRRELLKAFLRLGRTRPGQDEDPLIEEATGLAVAGGAAFGLEARIWAAVDLLGRTAQRQAALSLTDQLTAELETHRNLGASGDQWRLLLAFHAGQAGYPAASQRLLAPMISTGTVGQQEAAHAVLYAIGGPHADTRLQILVLEAELSATPLGADDDRLRLHRTLAADYATLADYRQALHHGQHELALRNRIQAADHPEVLDARANNAAWTGRSGYAGEALRLFRELLPDRERVLRPDHRDTLRTRQSIAFWTGKDGDAATALRLSRELLPDQRRVLGPDHPDTLRTRHNIAFWIGDCEDAARALRLFTELLPGRERVLGPDHPDTLSTRSDIAFLTGQCTDPAEALRLFGKLLADMERVLGPDHPDTLQSRHNFALWTGRCSDPDGAMNLFGALLPIRERVLGPDHPDTMNTLSNLAFWTGRCGDAAGALRLYTELLSHRERVLRPDHPDILNSRIHLATWTHQCGNAAEALRLFVELLPRRERALGPDHPGTLAIRNNIAFLTGECGEAAEAARLFGQLLADVERVLGPDHPSTLAIRNNLTFWAGRYREGGDTLPQPADLGSAVSAELEGP
jgi:Tetratricopeptide repeat